MTIQQKKRHGDAREQSLRMLHTGAEEILLGYEKIFVKIVGVRNQKSILNCKLFVTTQNGRVANSWKCSYFNQHPLQTICNMSEDVQYE